VFDLGLEVAHFPSRDANIRESGIKCYFLFWEAGITFYFLFPKVEQITK
jgi:hypothetical protein